ncbi:hypothetical protein LO762_06185 [Actinocorallia sp. API 0066]|uniref:hypothetical protein n=1 Tax=Actinocorallia sp. API 0066 TaxID=2896846 RepID=UPI001E5F1534|nr:hypothetical protein [Actinocorallia sp. API 0066]MCD0448785.1 hypothetical protein [Actinocorallia sp. API 0066]
MLTYALVLLCVAVGALELYAGRQSKYQAEAFVSRVRDLHDLVLRQHNRLESTGRELNDELAEVKQRMLPDLGFRVSQHGGRLDEMSSLLHRAEEYIRAQAIRLHELEKQRDVLAELRGRLADMEATSVPVAVPAIAGGNGDARVEAALTRIADLETDRGRVLELHRDLSTALEEIEDVVTDLLQYTSSELEGSLAATLDDGAVPVGTVAGSLTSVDPALREVLADVYERAVEGSGLTVRFKQAEERLTRYYLTGRMLEELGGGYTSLLISMTIGDGLTASRGGLPGDAASVTALLRALHESEGAVARIGPLVVSRTTDTLVAGVLTPAQSLDVDRRGLLADPVSATGLLRELPVHQVFDLTTWALRHG